MLDIRATCILPSGKVFVSDTAEYKNVHPKDGTSRLEIFLNRLNPAEYLITVNSKDIGYYKKEP